MLMNNWLQSITDLGLMIAHISRPFATFLDQRTISVCPSADTLSVHEAKQDHSRRYGSFLMRS